VKLNDGTIIHQQVAAAPDGQIALAAGGALAPQNVSLSSIKYVNHMENWTGAIVAGGQLTRGNTDTDQLSLSVKMQRRTEIDRISVDSGFLYGRQEVPGLAGKHETQNDWWIGGEYDYFFTPKFYGYVNGRVERDLIAGLSLRLTPGAGVGYNWIDKPDFHVHTEGGISWLYRDYTHGGGTNESIAARAAYHIDKKLTKEISVYHNLQYLPGLDTINDYYFDTDAGIRADINSKMFTEFKVREQYDSEPAPGKGHNDTWFILGVGLNF
jgi:putative salt-induced outer membrane protein YdiY